MNPLTLDQIKERKAHVEKMILTVLQDFETATGTEIESVDLSRVESIGSGSQILSVGLDIKVK